ncbi:MAG: hypothetical protein IT384_25810 [Deltaproteobacteria bacterium]|nr:hypothetical protein [Deltaproteobacteria bacterium]
MLLNPGECAPARDCTAGAVGDGTTIRIAAQAALLMEGAPEWVTMKRAPDASGEEIYVVCAESFAEPGDEAEVSILLEPHSATIPVTGSIVKTVVTVQAGAVMTVDLMGGRIEFTETEPIQALASLSWTVVDPNQPIPLVTWNVRTPSGSTNTWWFSDGAWSEVPLQQPDVRDYRVTVSPPRGPYVLSAKAEIPGVEAVGEVTMRVTTPDIGVRIARNSALPASDECFTADRPFKAEAQLSGPDSTLPNGKFEWQLFVANPGRTWADRTPAANSSSSLEQPVGCRGDRILLRVGISVVRESDGRASFDWTESVIAL